MSYWWCWVSMSWWRGWGLFEIAKVCLSYDSTLTLSPLAAHILRIWATCDLQDSIAPSVHMWLGIAGEMRDACLGRYICYPFVSEVLLSLSPIMTRESCSRNLSVCLIELITGERVLLLAAEDVGDKLTSTVAFEVNVEKFRVLHTCCLPALAWRVCVWLMTSL